MKKINEKATPYIIGGLISLGIAVAGGYYISTIPDAQPKYNSMKFGQYNLFDADRDSSVDLIEINGAPKYMNQNKKKAIKDNIPGNLFIDFARTKPIIPEIQAVADSVFNKNSNEKTLEKVLAEGK